MAQQEGEWITVNGRHIIIGSGESREEAINRSIANKNADKKNEQIAKNKEQADRLNNASKTSQKNNVEPVLDKVGEKGYHIKSKSKDAHGRTLYVGGIKDGAYQWVTDYSHAKLYSKGIAEKHLKTIKGK